MYSTPRGYVVFNAATIYWADGLPEPPGYQRPSDYVPRNGPDARVQTITRNLLDRRVGRVLSLLLTIFWLCERKRS